MDAATIWFQPTTLEGVQRARAENPRRTMLDHLGIEITEIGRDSLCGTMPVDHRTHQPYGLLHGGASAALAETLASLGANLTVDPAAAVCVGIELNCNHVSGCREGLVTGRASPLHLGRTTQVWEIRITQRGEKGDRLVCASRLTLSVLKK